MASSVSITGSLSIGIATIVCSSSRATLSCAPMPPVRRRYRVTINSRREFATRFTTLCETCNWSGRSVPRSRVARDDHVQFAGGIRQQQNAALCARQLNGSIHNGREDVFERKSRAERPGYFEQNAEVIQLART